MLRNRICYAPNDPTAPPPNPNDPPPPPPNPNDPPPPPPPAPEWLASLPDDLKGNDRLKGVPDVATLAKRFSTSIELPADDAKPEDRAAALDALAKKLGMPEKSTDYKMPEVKDRPYTEGDKQLQTAFAEVAHKGRLTQEQLDLVVGFSNDLTMKVIAHQTKVAGDTEAALRADLGDGFDAALELGNRAVDLVLKNAKVDVDTFRKLQLSDGSFAGDSKLMNALFIGVGKLIGETKFVKGDGGDKPNTPLLADQAYPSMNKQE